MEWQSRQLALMGDKAIASLAASHVTVFGAGGVGGYVIEALARAGVGKITVVDNDIFALSNINRQILATLDTVGKPKAETAASRILSINPDCSANAIGIFVTADNAEELVTSGKPDYIVDAIDNVTAKLAIISAAKKHDIPVISCMGTGNRLDPTRFRICDISKTSVCPLARVMRRELRARGTEHCEVLFSDEEPVKTDSRTPSSISYVPAAAGLILAGHVIRKCAGEQNL